MEYRDVYEGDNSFVYFWNCLFSMFRCLDLYFFITKYMVSFHVICKILVKD